MTNIILSRQIKLLCSCIILMCALSTFAFEARPNPIPPDCTLLTATGATATSGNAALAIDNNGGTRWESAFSDTESLTVDLGAAVNVNSVSIDWEAANAKDYVLSGSTDNENWTVISTKSNMPGGARTDVVDGINASYRYIKMQGVLRNLPYGYSIWEFYVCADAIVAPDCTAAVLASATATSGNADAAIDDNIATRWESAFSDPQTLTVDMGAVDFVKEISISWEAANAKDYTLSGSLNGTDWVTIGTYTNMPGGNRIDEIDNIEAEYRYFRMEGTARNLTYGYSIFEFDVCVGLEDVPEETEPLVCDSPVSDNTATATTGDDIAALAVDGNTGTRWASSIAPTATLTVDMGELVTVDFVKIDWEAANAKNYNLSGSVDGVDWTVIAMKTNMPAFGDHRIDDIVVGGVQYRYLKMDGITRNAVNGAFYGYSIWEFEICGERPITYTPVPARIEAEEWYAMHGVQTEVTADAGGGLHVAYIDTGDWMDYPIEVAAAGEYIIDARVSSVAATGVIEYLIDGSAIGTINVPNTGGWQVWQTISKALNLPAGQHMLRVRAALEQYNINWIEIKNPCFNWTGASSNEWATASNWCDGVVPTAYSDVVITAGANPVISSGTAYANNLTLNDGATLTVATGATLHVENTLTVAPLATLTVQDNGALLQSPAATVNNNMGKVLFHKRSNLLYRFDYTLWSAPITGQTLRTFAMGTSNNRFYVYKYDYNGVEYDEGYWPVDPLTTSFEPSKAYLIRMPNSNAQAGYNTGETPLVVDGVFNGVPNNGSYSPALSQEGNYYTGVGNPYPSPISLSDFLLANSTKLAADTGIWLWRKRNNSDNTSYLTLNLSGLVVPPGDTNGNGNLNDDLDGYYQGSNGSWIIAPGQGFIVQAQENLAEPVLTFTNSMRRATPGAQAFFKSAASTASRYWLNITSQNGGGSQALVAYSENGTMGIDFGYDSKVFGAETSVSLYSLATDNKLAIQARPEFEVADVVPMGFTAPLAGTYTIAIDHKDGLFAQGQDIYLKDIQEGVVRNLGTGNYTFTTLEGTFDGRFEVIYQTAALGTDNPALNANVLVYLNDSGINITAPDSITSVIVYDLQGRNIFESKSNTGNTFSTGALNAAHQAVIVKVKLANGCETTKKVML